TLPDTETPPPQGDAEPRGGGAAFLPHPYGFPKLCSQRASPRAKSRIVSARQARAAARIGPLKTAILSPAMTATGEKFARAGGSRLSRAKRARERPTPVSSALTVEPARTVAAKSSAAKKRLPASRINWAASTAPQSGIP